jgi:hypothetical protein
MTEILLGGIINMGNENLEKSSKIGNQDIMRTITIEEHYASPAFLEGPGRRLKEAVRMGGRFGYPNLIEHLSDIGDIRIAEMDAAGIDMQVMSLTDPSVQQLDATEAVALARESNDYLADAAQLHPTRFAGFATLPTAAPDTAADELERTVSEHGFKGGVINGHSRGRYLDDKFFWPILERAESLKVPLYIHPTPPPQPVIDAYYSGFSPAVMRGLANGGWGWHIETAVHVLRLIFGGVFDRFPDLQVIIGHMGETLPFMLPRIDRNMPKNMTNLNRTVAAYLRENIYYTFSGFNFIPTFLDLYLQIGADRIIFSADYPYGSMVEARTFLDQLPVSTADKNRIAHGNAERLLRL